jgi:hypothetical protein
METGKASIFYTAIMSSQVLKECMSSCSDPKGTAQYGRGGVATESKKIFVGGLAPSVTEQDFRQYFEEFGKITDAVVMIDRDTQRSRGFGFISFEEEVFKKNVHIVANVVLTLLLFYRGPWLK